MEFEEIDDELNKKNLLVYFTLEKQGIGLEIRNLDLWPSNLKMIVAAVLQETATKISMHETDPKTDNPTYN